MPRSALRVRNSIVALMFGAMAMTALPALAQVPDIQPTSHDRDIVKIVSVLLERWHVAKPTINDEISKRWMSNYIKSLDGRKYVFLKADVEEFSKLEKDLDDTIASGDLSIAKKIMDRYQQRQAERYEQAQEILKTSPDFTIDETIVDADQLDYPASADEAKDRLRKIVKLSLLSRKVAKTDDAEALKQIAIELKDGNRAIRQFDNADLLSRYLTALAMAIDPHSSYMDAKEFEDINQRLHLTLDGIGAQLLTVDGYPTIQEIVPGGAADKDGRLQVDDKIIAVIFDDGTRESFVEKKLSEVVRKIRGKRGTKVKLVVIPAESKEEKVYELTRAKIDLVADKAKGQVIEYKSADRATPRKIGILNVPSFYGNSAAALDGDPDAASLTRDARKILKGFKDQGVEVVVVDVRQDPGGLLDEAISFTGLFVDKGPIVQVREDRGVHHRDDNDEGTAWDGPMVVVIDKFCASASEIFAGAIKDYGRGLVVGDSSSFGKGSVQNVIPLNEKLGIPVSSRVPHLGALKLTIQQFYLPDGDSTQIKGVTPHLHIPSVNDMIDYGESRYDSAMKFDKVAPLPHDRYNRVPADLLARLTEKSEARRKSSSKFQEEEKFIAKTAERKKRHEVPLNEQKFRDEVRADDKAEDAKPKGKGKGKKPAKDPDIVWESEYYNDEILNIVDDYVTFGQRILLAEPVKATVNVDRAPARP